MNSRGSDAQPVCLIQNGEGLVQRFPLAAGTLPRQRMRLGLGKNEEHFVMATADPLLFRSGEEVAAKSQRQGRGGGGAGGGLVERAGVERFMQQVQRLAAPLWQFL